MDTETTRNNDTDQITRQLADINFYANEGAHSIHALHQKIKNDIEKNEAYLDLHCDEISRDINLNLSTEPSFFDSECSSEVGTLRPIDEMLEYKTNRVTKVPPISAKAPRTASCLPRFNITAGKPMKRTPLDPQRKSKLLAQLKSIQSGNGCL